MTRLLDARSLEIAYGDVAACRDISFHVDEGEIVALIGANGAGKSTTLRAVAGAMLARAGRIEFGGTDVTRLPSHARSLLGIALVPEGLLREIEGRSDSMNDWNTGGQIEDFMPIFKDWKFDWLDVPSLIRDADQVLQYPMVDKDPIAQWTFGRVTLMGDAAHPMYPRGSNGSAQALIDARTLAAELASETDPLFALQSYETKRREVTSRIVQTNRSVPPDFINIKVDELAGDKPFKHIDDLISQRELREISERYKKIAGFSLETEKAS